MSEQQEDDGHYLALMRWKGQKDALCQMPSQPGHFFVYNRNDSVSIFDPEGGFVATAGLLDWIVCDSETGEFVVEPHTLRYPTALN